MGSCSDRSEEVVGSEGGGLIPPDEGSYLSVGMMNDPLSVGFSGVAMAAVFLQCNDQQRHTGFIYQSQDGVIRACHLAWQDDLRIEPATLDDHSNSFWVEISFNDTEKNMIAGFCDLVKASEKNVPYGFDHNSVDIDDLGNITKTKDESGLTCATLVMKIIEKVTGNKLLCESEWEPLPEDRDWQVKMTGNLQRGRHRERTAGVEKGVGNPRFRPEHVVAGCVVEDHPVCYSIAHSHGIEHVKFIEESLSASRQ